GEALAGRAVDDSFLLAAAISRFRQGNVPEAQQFIPESDARVCSAYWNRGPIGSLVLWLQSHACRICARSRRLCRSCSAPCRSLCVSASAATSRDAGKRAGLTLRV